MNKYIAERKLLQAGKGSDEREELIIRIGIPYVVDQNDVNFPIDEGVSGCTTEFDGLLDISTEETYGTDSLQAIQLAVNVEPILERLRRKYDFYFPTGEGYFDSQNFDQGISVGQGPHNSDVNHLQTIGTRCAILGA